MVKATTNPISKTIRLLLISGIFLIAHDSFFAQTTRTSTGTGNWEDISWTPAGNPEKSDNVFISNGSVTIPYGTTYEVGTLTIDSGGTLIVNGNLIVHGNLLMTNTSLGFSMGPNAAVIVFGNFEIKNQVELSLSSLLVVYGNFTKSGSSNQGDLTINDGNIFVFGEVDGNGWPNYFGCTEEEYSGTTPTGGENCDYGDETDFEENQDIVPDEIRDIINCFDLSDIAAQDACVGGTAEFSVNDNTSANYTWEKQDIEGNWIPVVASDDIIISGALLTLKNVTSEMSGSQYRVKATAKEVSSTCSVSVSRKVGLTVSSDITWTGFRSIAWSDPLNWSCNSIPTAASNVIIPSGLTNYPLIDVGITGDANKISIEVDASLQVKGTLRLAEVVLNEGTLDVKAGTAEFFGTGAKSIAGDVFVDSRINNLVVNNGSSITLTSDLEISGKLLALSGNFISNGFLTLLSDANKTALISGDGTGEVVGQVTMQRYLNPAFGYKYFSTPFSTSTVADFESQIALKDASNNFPHFYRYDENREDSPDKDASGWESYIDPSGPLNVMEGYAVNFGAEENELTLSFSGEVNNGELSKMLYNHNGIYTQGFNLVGNPYPSPIDWNSSEGWTKTYIDDAIYFFTASTSDQYTGTYSSYINGGPSTDGKASGIIPSMQGFFVHVNLEATQGVLGINNNARIDDFSQEFLKSAQPKTFSLIRLSSSFAKEGISDPMVLYFRSSASPSFDSELDALKMMNTQVNVPSLYSLSPEGKELSINALPINSQKEQVRIPLGLNLNQGGSITIQLEDLENLPSEYSRLYLIDKEKQVIQELDQKGTYTTTISEGIHNKRFELILSKVAITEKASILEEAFRIKTIDGKTYLHLNLGEKVEGNITVTSLSGQILQRLKGKYKEQIELESIRTSGIYIISLESLGSRTVKKVLIKK